MHLYFSLSTSHLSLITKIRIFTTGAIRDEVFTSHLNVHKKPLVLILNHLLLSFFSGLDE